MEWTSWLPGQPRRLYLHQNTGSLHLHPLEDELESPQSKQENPVERGLSDQGSVVHSHWSMNVEARISLVESFIKLLRQLSYAIKNKLGHPKPLVGALERKDPTGLYLLLAGSLWHKG